MKINKILSIIITASMIVCLLPAMPMSVAAEEAALPTVSGSVLTGGSYVVSEDTVIYGYPCQSALIVSGNVTITIKEGVKLTVKGGRADATVGGGAGIEVPFGSSLTILGKGTLEAKGGDAAKGENGEDGGNGAVDGVTAVCSSGKGGSGGNGGGGAGAGIGGKGGNGGAGGAGGDSVVGATAISGLNGSSGIGGEAGGACGDITIASTVNLTAKGGLYCDDETVGGSRGLKGRGDFHYTYLAFGGGGGGAGGSGYGGANIGSGGYGGCGGGGGGSGSDEWFGYQYKIDGCIAFGLPGYGGLGFKNGANGKDYGDSPIYTDGYDPGNGGFGGNYGSVSEEYLCGQEKQYKTLTVIKVPKAIDGLEYTGNTQTGVPDGAGYTISGSSAKNTGTYYATARLSDGYIWEDNTTEDKKIEWYIGETITYLEKSYTDGNLITEEKSVHIDRRNYVKTGDTVWGSDNEETWYVVYGDYDAKDSIGHIPYEVVLKNRPEVRGTVHLVLLNGKRITPSKGIEVSENAHLMIHAQSDDEDAVGKIVIGKLTAPSYKTGIGGAGSVTIHGGNITVNGGNGAGIGMESGGACSDINIYGGNITANSGSNGAGIGTENGGTCNNINIYGGTVTTTGGNNGAGIGTGNGGTCNNINIYGGDVTAKGGCGAGIGTGYGGTCNDINIYGGTVTAKNESEGAGIGTGDRGTCNDINIYGGDVTATGERQGAGIGAGFESTCNDINIYGGDITANGGNMGAGIGAAEKGTCNDINIYGGDVTANGLSFSDGIGTGYGGTCNNINIYGGTVTATAGEDFSGRPTAFKGVYGIIKGEVRILPYLMVRKGDAEGEIVSDWRQYADIGLTNRQITITNPKGIDPLEAHNLEYSDENFHKCSDCEFYDAHCWEYISDIEHKCAECDKTEPHSDADCDGKCDLCGIAAIVVFYEEAATCEKPGHITYYKNAEKYYSDRACTQEINDLTEWLSTDVESGGGKTPATGHTWKPGTGEDYLYHVCEVCKAKEKHILDEEGKCFCGYDSDYFEISTANDWLAFRNMPSSGEDFSGKTVLLLNDISVDTMCTGEFSGIFDGCGHTIHITYSQGIYVGSMFQKLTCASVINLTVDGVTRDAGFTTESDNSVFINCTNLSSSVSSATTPHAGFAFTTKDSSFENCISCGADSGLGGEGFVTTIVGNTKFINCASFGEITGEKAYGIGRTISDSNVSLSNIYIGGDINGSSEEYLLTDGIGNVTGSNIYAATKYEGMKIGCDAEVTYTSDIADVLEMMNAEAANHDGWYKWEINDEGKLYLVSPYHPEEAPTCAKPGHIGYYEYGGKYYKDALYKYEITDLDEWLSTDVESGGGMTAPATGHTWKHGTGEDYLYHVCEVCKAKENHILNEEGKCICGYDSDYFEISTAEDWLAFRNMVNHGEDFSGKTVLLLNDINDITADTRIEKFSGIFDGCGHTIHITYSQGIYVGSMFQKLTCAAVINLTVDGITQNAGFAKESYNSVFINCTNLSSSTSSATAPHAGFAINAKDSSFENCISCGVDSCESGKGFVSTMDGSTKFINCATVGEITGEKAYGIGRTMYESNVSLSNIYIGGDINGSSEEYLLTDVIGNVTGSNISAATKYEGMKIGCDAEVTYTSDIADVLEMMNAEAANHDGWYKWEVDNDGKLYLVSPYHPEEAPTCVKPGHIRYYEYGGKYYKDALYKYEITDLDEWLSTDVESGGGMTAPATGIHIDSEPDGYCDMCGEFLGNRILLETEESGFTVKLIGKNTGSGVVYVALFDSEDTSRLLDVKIFDLSKTDNLTGAFDESGYVKAFWWSDFATLIPICDAESE